MHSKKVFVTYYISNKCNKYINTEIVDKIILILIWFKIDIAESISKLNT